MKAYLKAIVRTGGKGRLGLGIEMFRLEAAEDVDLTDSEKEGMEGGEVSSTAIMRIYEEIGENFWDGSGISAKKFAAELDELGDLKRLNIHINCLGGDAFTAQAIHSIISEYKTLPYGKKTSYIDGVCASAATLVASAADEVIARHNSNYMIHNPWAMAIGNAEVMRKAAEDLDKITVPIVSVYQEQVKGKIDEEKIRELMDAETWMTAEEAAEYGFVDQVRGKVKPIVKANNSQIFCSGKLLNFSKWHYRNMPSYPVDKTSVAPDPKPGKIFLDSKPEPKDKPMTAEELERDHSEVVNSIRQAAMKAERDRLASLDAMSAPGCEPIIAKAKLEGKQPSEIAMECYDVARQQLASTNQLQNLRQDAAPAASIPAGDAPIVKPQVDKQKKATEMMVKAFDARKTKFAVNGRR
jgi:ATP-dependent Clp protease, protease subunit